MQNITLTGSTLTIEEVVAVARHRAEVSLSADDGEWNSPLRGKSGKIVGTDF